MLRDEETNQCAANSDRAKRRARGNMNPVEADLRGQNSHGRVELRSTTDLTIAAEPGSGRGRVRRGPSWWCGIWRS
jgi:hypothetical protein